jgi:hypothetical protein
MKTEDILPECLRRLRTDADFERRLRSSMPREVQLLFDAVSIEGMFRSDGTLTHSGAELVDELNAALPVVEATLDGIGAREIETRPPAAPGLLKRAGSLAHAIGAETKAMVQRQPMLSAQQVAARIAVCASCDRLRSNRTCAQCGCFVDAKARFRSQTCPLRKWPAK